MNRNFNNDRLAKSLERPRPHGTRTRYQQGCRCLQCRVTNAEYQKQLVAQRKAGRQVNRLVSVEPVLKHIARLSKAGLGLRQIGVVTDIHLWKLAEIRAGRRKNIRANHARKILAVTPDMLADGAHVPVGPVKRMLRQLNREGFTYDELSARIGVARTSLTKRKGCVSARTRLKVQQFYQRIMAAA